MWPAGMGSALQCAGRRVLYEGRRAHQQFALVKGVQGGGGELIVVLSDWRAKQDFLLDSQQHAMTRGLVGDAVDADAVKYIICRQPLWAGPRQWCGIDRTACTTS